jgi:hypothetical protein
VVVVSELAVFVPDEGTTSALIPTSLWEVAGLSPTKTWCGVYQSATRAGAYFQVREVIKTWNTDPVHRKFSDFRVVPPTGHPDRDVRRRKG